MQPLLVSQQALANALQSTESQGFDERGLLISSWSFGWGRICCNSLMKPCLLHASGLIYCDILRCGLVQYCTSACCQHRTRSSQVLSQAPEDTRYNTEPPLVASFTRAWQIFTAIAVSVLPTTHHELNVGSEARQGSGQAFDNQTVGRRTD